METDDDITYWIEDTSIVCKNICLGTEVTPEYPSAWFLKNERKPSVTIPRTGSTLAQLRGGILEGIKVNNFSLVLAKEYLYTLFMDKPERCELEWTSFGQKISDADKDVDLSNLAVIERTEDPKASVSSVTGSPADDKWLAAYMLAPYRICPATHHLYADKLIKM